MNTVDAKRRTVLKAVGSAGILLGIGGASSAAAAGGRPSDSDTLVDVAVASDDFEVLVEAVTKAGLVDALSGNRQLTVFAPTDEAFANLLEELGVGGLADLDDDLLVDVLTYHVVPGRRFAASVVNARKLPTLNGAPIEVDGTELNDGQATITDTDIEASNGVIHVIDGVLLPPVE